jgi:hypothetical protein
MKSSYRFGVKGMEGEVGTGIGTGRGSMLWGRGGGIVRSGFLGLECMISRLALQLYRNINPECGREKESISTRRLQ